jgi:hypothetical protein
MDCKTAVSCLDHNWSYTYPNAMILDFLKIL